MIDVILNSKVLTIVLAVILVGLVAANALGYVSDTIFLMAMGLFGFPNVMALRDWIKSQGWITYAFSGLGLLGTAAVFFGFIPPDKLIYILTIFGGGAAVGVANGIKKAVENGEGILK